jgi:predicted ATP-dependent endonuclease of OLD family
MKISRIEITDFQQFKDFTLDLTYPAGHPKAGQPLDKVCFIGQSGTGKTTILRIIKQILDAAIANNNSGNILDGTEFCAFKIISKNPDVTFQSFKYNYEEKNNSFIVYSPIDIEFKQKLFYIYFNANMLDRNIDCSISEDELNKYLSNSFKYQLDFNIDFNEKKYDFNIDNPIKIWKIILLNNRIFIKNLINITEQISKQIILKNNFENIETIKDWRKNQKNYLQNLANKLNPILNEFNLEVLVDFDFTNIENMKFTPISHKINGQKYNEINFEDWSTGTKQVVLTALPLFGLDTKDTIIMFDEPERSLFPDIQRRLINHYTNLAPEAQFFFATHSPIIASQFEPCERFILSFDENGKVQVKKGDENAPIGDEPNDILLRDFGLEDVYTEEGLKAKKRFIKLLSLIHNEKDKSKKDVLTNEYLDLQRKYNF